MRRFSISTEKQVKIFKKEKLINLYQQKKVQIIKQMTLITHLIYFWISLKNSKINNIYYNK